MNGRKAAASKAEKKTRKKRKRKKGLLLSAGLGSAAGPGPAFSLSLSLVLDLGAALLKPDAPPPASHMLDWQLVTTASRRMPAPPPPWDEGPLVLIDFKCARTIKQ